jgi:ABC-type proline/glycine betaine transport system ATPase subunit
MEFARIQHDLGTTVFLVTHDIAEAFALAGRIGVMDDGRLVACDHPSHIAASTDARVRQFVDAVPQRPGGEPTR